VWRRSANGYEFGVSKADGNYIKWSGFEQEVGRPSLHPHDQCAVPIAQSGVPPAEKVGGTVVHIVLKTKLKMPPTYFPRAVLTFLYGNGSIATV
jgi:hypothetical protein